MVEYDRAITKDEFNRYLLDKEIRGEKAVEALTAEGRKPKEFLVTQDIEPEVYYSVIFTDRERSLMLEKLAGVIDVQIDPDADALMVVSLNDASDTCIG